MGMMDRRKQIIKKNNNRGILFVENYHGKITFLLLMLPWKHRKFLASALV